jgi:predicted flap endonuclease-1-like 5' DNA nuclease
MPKVTETSGAFPKTSAPAARALAGAGYTRLAQLTKVTEKELLQLHGMGPKAVRILREALAAQGLAFKPEPKDKG